MPEPELRHVFVYGTLRRGQANDITRLHPAPRFVGRARIRGTMFDLGTYPGVVLDGASFVHGEVYEIAQALKRQLDAIEEVYPQESGEYARRHVVVSVACLSLRCLVYEINPHHVQGRPRIPSGDWVSERA